MLNYELFWNEHSPNSGIWETDLDIPKAQQYDRARFAAFFELFIFCQWK
jgi:hypothetical protein